MHRLPAHRRIALLTQGHLGVFTAKTAASLLRYRGGDVCAVVDAAHAGADVRALVPWSPPVPVVASVDEALTLGADALYIGIAPVGGELPAEMCESACRALLCGVDVVSGLHAFLDEIDPLVRAANAGGGRMFDVRRPPAERRIATAAARATRAVRVLTVGTDCNVGKMTASLEMRRVAAKQGLRTAFVPTGQTGIMIEGWGICVDAVVADFAAGATEALVLHAANADVAFIEGQGSIGHPGYSGVTLSILHGACPDALVLVHHAGRTHYRAEPHHALPALRDVCAAYERLAALVHPAPIAAVALNTFEAEPGAVERDVESIQRELGLPVVDPVHDGAEALLDAALRVAPLRSAVARA